MEHHLELHHGWPVARPPHEPELSATEDFQDSVSPPASGSPPATLNANSSRSVQWHRISWRGSPHDAVRMLEEHEPRAAAMALVACRQRLALAACFYPGTCGAQFTLPEDVVVRIVELRHNLHMPQHARYELTRAPRMAVVCSPAPCMPHLHPARTPG